MSQVRKMKELGLEPSDLPCNDKDLQRSIAPKAENEGENREKTAPPALQELARILTSLSPEDQTTLSRLLSTDEKEQQS